LGLNTQTFQKKFDKKCGFLFNSMRMDQKLSNNKKIKYTALTAIIILLALMASFWVFSTNSKTSTINKTSSSKPDSANSGFVAETVGKTQLKARLADKEADKLSQQFNALLRQDRKNKGQVFNWNMGWWDADSVNQCKDESGKPASKLPKVPADTGSEEIPKDKLSTLVPVPKTVEKKSFIQYVGKPVEAPIIITDVEDMFATNSDGSINLSQRIDDSAIDSPTQKKLDKGPVHLAISPLPGEKGNSYISGHTSNFGFIDSAYKTIFKPLERSTKVGEKFYIWDCEGRKLQFDVFESLEINAGDTSEAWKDYPNDRVVTLQGSILETVNGKLEPTKRWLTRGKLNLQESIKLNPTK
jgi:hypothetical protein